MGLLLVCIIGVLLARMYEPELRELMFWWTTFRGHALKAADVLTLKPGQQFAECIKIWSDDQKTHQIRRYCPDMIVVPSGTFMMGEKGEGHEVTIAKAFAVSKFAVTFDQWDACVSGGGCDNYRPSDNSWGRDTRPVIIVNWDDAQRYVKWLNKMTGTKSYRLLSEAEFEYAARAGTLTAYPWGDDIGKGNANCTVCDSQWVFQTAPVGSFKANAFDLYDMQGNVWQWVEDCKTYEDGSACQGIRVVRGGSWINNAEGIRAANRSESPFGLRYVDLGFRVGRTLPSPFRCAHRDSSNQP